MQVFTIEIQGKHLAWKMKKESKKYNRLREGKRDIEKDIKRQRDKVALLSLSKWWVSVITCKLDQIWLGPKWLQFVFKYYLVCIVGFIDQAH